MVAEFTHTHTDTGLGILEVGGSGCEVRPVAYDGVWRSVIPHPNANNRYELTGASRIDLAIRCARGIHSIMWFDGQVASLNATNGNRTGATPYSLNSPWSPPGLLTCKTFGTPPLIILMLYQFPQQQLTV